jgi:6-phosphogluconolactonase (cycloisomerase 2 family)
MEVSHAKNKTQVNFGSGKIRLKDADAASGNKPIDLATTADGRFLYALNSADGTVGALAISPYGTLKDLGTVAGLPLLFAQGIAAR